MFVAVDLRLVKDIRPGKASRDFEKWMDDSRKHDAGVCFVLFYGIEFRLKTLSLAGEGLPRALPIDSACRLSFRILSCVGLFSSFVSSTIFLGYIRVRLITNC